MVADDLADHMGSSVVVAFVGFASQPSGRHPSCYQQRVAVVQGREAGSVRAHPIEGLVGLLWCQPADMLVGGHPVAVVRRPGLVGRLLVGP